MGCIYKYNNEWLSEEDIIKRIIFNKISPEEIALELSFRMGFSVEINTAKAEPFIDRSEIDTYIYNEEEYVDAGFGYFKNGNIEITEQEYNEAKNKGKRKFEEKPIQNTQYYSNLSAPGGTGKNKYEGNPDWVYQELRFVTPLITPSIKGHAQFAEANDIGWARVWYNKKTGVVEVQEFQSDLFQKGRDKQSLTQEESKISKERLDSLLQEGRISKENYDIRISKFTNITSENQFLQLLNKDNNWVTFFIKSIIQDSAKKGYEKVLFPKGETAAKIEGHETIADEIKRINEEIKIVNNKKAPVLGEPFDAAPTNLSIRAMYMDDIQIATQKDIDNFERNKKIELEKLEQRKSELKNQGIEKLKPIEGFYEIRVGNILEKLYGKDNVKTITDEYGNQWREIEIKPERDLQNIVFAEKDLNDDRGLKDLLSDLTLHKTPKYFRKLGNKKQITLTELFDYLEKNGTPLTRSIINKLKAFNIPSDVIINLSTKEEIESRDDYEALNLKRVGGANGIFGFQYTNNKLNDSGLEITFNIDTLSNSKFNLTALHELIHLYTYTGYRNANIELKTELDKLFLDVKNKLIETKLLPADYYNLSNIDEFMTGVFTDKALIRAISSIPSDKKGFNNLWEEILNWIKDLLGLNKDEVTMLDEAMSKIIEVMDSQSNYYRTWRTNEIHDYIMDISPMKSSYFDYIMSEWNKQPKTRDGKAIYTYYSESQAKQALENLKSTYKTGVGNINYISKKEFGGKDVWKIFVDKPNNSTFTSKKDIELENIIKNEVTYTDEQGNPCAKMGGRSSKFTKGSQWEIVKDLKGYPSHAQGGVDIKLGKDGFSFKGKGGDIKAAHGLVLPAKAADGLTVGNTNPPTVEDYAQDGSLIPDWDKVKSILNPMNWGVNDYTDKGDFNSAYSNAREAGEKEFMWNNKRYNTNYEGTPKQQIQETGITDDQLQDRGFFHKRFFDNMYPRGYESNEYGNPNLSKTIKRVSDAVIFNNKDPKRNELIKEDIPRMDAFSLYSGVPQQNKTFGISDYRPSKSSEDTYYYKLNDENLKDEIINNLFNITTISDYKKYFSDDEINILKEKKDEAKIKELRQRLLDEKSEDAIRVHNNYIKQSLKNNFGINIFNDLNVMGNYKVDKGVDERGEYISYYDKWDLAPLEKKPNLLGIDSDYENKRNMDYFGKPIEIYDRIYIKDYGDGQKKRMYYSDKELSTLDVNKKNFDTLALQRELVNRGYKLPKSTKKDGDFDGIWGEETKNALLDYQTKNKTEQ